jgi:hypothetical protein
MIGHYLAMNPGTVEEEIKGIKTIEPAFGLPALWIKEEDKERAQIAGYTVVDITTGLPSSTTDTMMFINTSTSSVSTQDDGYITTDIMLNTLNETITISRQVTTSHEYDDLNDTENSFVSYFLSCNNYVISSQK